MSLNSLFWWNRFTKLESALLESLQATLPPEPRSILEQQLRAITSIRRFSGDREVLCYRKKGRHLRGKSVLPFPAQRAELKFCTIHFSLPGLTKSWTADFHSVSGYFFSIAFTPAAKGIKNRKDIQVDRVDILADLMVRTPERSFDTQPLRREVIDLPGWVKELERIFPVSDLYAPLAQSVRMQFQNEMTGVLPGDYLELINLTEGLTVGKISVLGISQVYEVVLPDWNYYLIAELHCAGTLAVKAHGLDSGIYFLDYEGGAPRRIGLSLKDAVRELLVRPEH